MKKQLISSTILVSMATVNVSAAVDITLGGSIDMGVDYGLGKKSANFTLGRMYQDFELTISAAETTDFGLRYGGLLSVASLQNFTFLPYSTDDGGKYMVKATVSQPADIKARAYNVSGGEEVAESKIVAVKINSDWHALNDTKTSHFFELSAFSQDNVCKVAGRAGPNVGTTGPQFFSQTEEGRILTTGSLKSFTQSISSLFNIRRPKAGDYLPVGQVANWNLYTIATASTVNANPDAVTVTAIREITNWVSAGGISASLTLPNANQTDLIRFRVTGTYSTTLTAVATPGPGGVGGQRKNLALHVKDRVAVTLSDEAVITGAEVYGGPFMQVRTASSMTKLVVGAACIEGQDTSATEFFLDNTSPVLRAGDAKIFVEGGFGTLSLQSDNYDYVGSVAPILEAGGQSDIDPDGPVLVLESANILGLRPYAAIDFLRGDVLLGGSISLSGFQAALDLYYFTDTNENRVFDLAAWDAGLRYFHGLSEVSIVLDSASQWGVSAATHLVGFDVLAQASSRTQDDHAMGGLNYALEAATTFDRLGVRVAIDQALAPEVALSYDLEGLNFYLNYEVVEAVGSIGAKFGF